MRIFLFIFIFGIPVNSWSCGEGKFTEGLAWLIAAPSDTNSVNRCCEIHDKNYDNFCAGVGSISLQTADFLFNRCLDNINSRWVRYVVKPLYSAAINVNSWWKRATRNPC